MTSSRPDRFLRLAVLALAGSLAACSSDGGDWMNMFRSARALWDERDAAITLDEAASIPYATLGVRMDGGREQVMVLATDQNGTRLWSSSGGVALETRHGRITRTVGFGSDLGGYSVQSSAEEDWFTPHQLRWKGDFPDLGYYGVAVVCDVTPAGPEPITILGQSFDTVRIDESCRADQIGWNFADSYWVSRTSGRVWRSIVHFHPKGPELDLEILRPPLSQG